jgi:hypothetical protein
MSTSNSKALVDNWMLEAAANVLDCGLDPTPFDMQIWEQVNPDEWRKEFINRIQAFLDFLEVFVLHDDVYYEKGRDCGKNPLFVGMPSLNLSMALD